MVSVAAKRKYQPQDSSVCVTSKKYRKNDFPRKRRNYFNYNKKYLYVLPLLLDIDNYKEKNGEKSPNSISKIARENGIPRNTL